MRASSGGRPKKIIRILDHILIERVAAGHHKRDRAPLPPARAAGLLPRAGDRARVAVQHTRLQLPDIDAELQRIRADDAANFPLRSPRSISRRCFGK